MSLRKRVDPDPKPLPEIYATATHLLTGSVGETLGPFDTPHDACAAVIERVGHVLVWQRMSTGAYIAGKPPTLWRVEVRVRTSWPPITCPLC